MESIIKFQTKPEGGWLGILFFSCSIMIHRFGKSIFSDGFLQHLTQRYINPSHCLGLTPQHCNNNANFFFFVARLKVSLSLQRTQTCKSLELFCGHNYRLQWEQDRSHWVLSCLREKLKTNKKPKSICRIFSVFLNNLWQLWQSNRSSCNKC